MVATIEPTKIEDLSAIMAKLESLEERVTELEEEMPENRVTIVVFSGDLDRLFAAFIIATGALAMGYEVSMFFTFWGLNAVREQRDLGGKNMMEKMMSLMSPAGTDELGLSKMNFFGAGAKMMRRMMKEKNVQSFEELVEMTHELGARFVSCGMSQMVMGISDEELRDNMDEGGVATYLGDAISSKMTLFI